MRAQAMDGSEMPSLEYTIVVLRYNLTIGIQESHFQASIRASPLIHDFVPIAFELHLKLTHP